MPFAQWGYPHVAGSVEKFEKNFPANFISEAIDQTLTRLALFCCSWISTLVFPEKKIPHPYETCIVLGHVGDKEGKKESKSKGNYTPGEIVYDEVKLEFAVVDVADFEDRAQERRRRASHKKISRGSIFRPARSCASGMPSHGRDMPIQGAKGLPRRVIALSASDIASLRKNRQKSDVKVTEVSRLPENASHAPCGTSRKKWTRTTCTAT